jgi:hypothetical protein
MSRATAPLSTANQARHAASEILSASRFHQPKFPRPLHGLLNSFGQILEAPLHALNSLVNSIGTSVPGGVAAVWAILGVAVVAVVALVAARSARGRVAALASPTATGKPDASELERLAAAAQAAGRFEEAVRLRFRAGLARLAERQVIISAPTRPSADISRALDSSRFDSLAGRFDEIVYGASPATTEDVDQQGREWPEILKASKSTPGAGARP